jgi:hypothetical protein
MRILAALLAFSATLAHAASTTTDFSDLWFNANEEGWGANVVHQRDTLFITLFVYGPNNQPTWYVASDVSLTSNANGVLTYSGALFRITGPWFGGAFDENNVNVTPVGTIAFAASQLSSAGISYVVDGVQVTKTVTRQTWKAETLAGDYLGHIAGDWNGCNGNMHTEFAGNITVTHNNTNVTVRESTSTYTCNYSGTYEQAGRMGTVTGTGTCTDGFNPSFVMSEIDVSAHSLIMRMSAESGSCRFTGRMGGIRR